MFKLVQAALLLSPCLLFAQFSSLSTTADGSRVYFATPLRQKNTNQPNYGKLFRYDEGGLALQETRTEIAPAPVPSGIQGVGQYTLSNAYNLIGIDVSSDGTTMAAAGSRDCAGDTTLCIKKEESVLTTITTSGYSHEFDGNLRLSANGRWAFGFSSFGMPWTLPRGFLLDVVSGVETTVLSENYTWPFQVGSVGRPVANDGTATYCNMTGVVIYQSENFRRIASTTNHDWPVDAAIDAAGRFVVYTVIRNTGTTNNVVLNQDNPKSLYRVAVSGGEPVQLAQEGYSASISDDGITILYLGRVNGTPQIWVMNSDGSSPRQITTDPAGIASATLSGDGRTAFAYTLGGRIIRVGIASGEITELVPRTPWLDSDQYTAPDRFTIFTGAGFAESDKTQATIQGEPAIVAAIQPSAISILVPPDVPVTTYPNPESTLTLTGNPGSPFEGPRTDIRVLAYAPGFLFDSMRSSVILAAHQDWSAVVTAANPARPGEVVHAYAIGLGPTAPVVPYGQPAPSAEPFARLTSNYTCATDTNDQLTVFYQGLAPGMRRIYQIDFQVPANAEPGNLPLSCLLGALGGPGFSGVVPVAAVTTAGPAARPHRTSRGDSGGLRFRRVLPQSGGSASGRS
jgi:uncharacterized protein (TIGR03437 family)